MYEQRSGLTWKSCRSWSEFWEIQTLICKEMCKKFLVLTKSCRSRTDGPALVSNTVYEYVVNILEKIWIDPGQSKQWITPSQNQLSFLVLNLLMTQGVSVNSSSLLYCSTSYVHVSLFCRLMNSHWLATRSNRCLIWPSRTMLWMKRKENRYKLYADIQVLKKSQNIFEVKTNVGNFANRFF